MEKLKEYKYIILIFLVVIGVVFYWFEWRPKEIKKECLKNQLDYEGKLRKDISEAQKRDKMSVSDSQFKIIEETIRERSENTYKQCLIGKGL